MDFGIIMQFVLCQIQMFAEQVIFAQARHKVTFSLTARLNDSRTKALVYRIKNIQRTDAQLCSGSISLLLCVIQ